MNIRYCQRPLLIVGDVAGIARVNQTILCAQAGEFFLEDVNRGIGAIHAVSIIHVKHYRDVAAKHAAHKVFLPDRHAIEIDIGRRAQRSTDADSTLGCFKNVADELGATANLCSTYSSTVVGKGPASSDAFVFLDFTN